MKRAIAKIHVATAERPLLLTLIPEHDAGRYFSLMLLSSRAASFVGPLIWGYTIDTLEPGAGTLTAYHVGLGTQAENVFGQNKFSQRHMAFSNRGQEFFNSEGFGECRF